MYQDGTSPVRRSLAFPIWSTLPPLRPSLAALVALVAACSASAGGAGCSCPSASVVLDDFEGCAGTCGWTVSGGSATVVSTILPGEHALQIGGGATAAQSVPIFSIDTTYSLQMVADCPAGLAATLTATEPGAGDVAIPVMLSLDTTLDSSGNTPDYTGATYVPLIGTIDLPSGLMSVAIHQITLQPSAGATCTVDVIRVTSATPCSD
jgi:hypothetical protein